MVVNLVSVVKVDIFLKVFREKLFELLDVGLCVCIIDVGGVIYFVENLVVVML